MRLRSIIGQQDNSSIISRVKLRQTTVQLCMRQDWTMSDIVWVSPQGHRSEQRSQARTNQCTQTPVYLGVIAGLEQRMKQRFSPVAIHSFTVTASAAWYMSGKLVEELHTERRPHIQEHVLHSNMYTIHCSTQVKNQFVLFPTCLMLVFSQGQRLLSVVRSRTQQEGWLSPTKRASAAKINYYYRLWRLYDFLLVRHCNYSSILYYLWVIWRRIISWPWKLA